MAATKSIAALLPFGSLFDPVYETIARIASQNGAVAARLDSEFSATNRLGEICAQIEAADLVIADLTARNPHVMYEAGYAHGIGKPILFIARYGEDFPFDKSRHPVLIYSGDPAFLAQELDRYLRTGQASPEPSSAAPTDTKAKFAEIFGDILTRHQHEHRGPIEMENEKTFVLLNQDMDLALVQDLSRKARELGLRIKLM